jgi:hypothetical protein
MGVAAGGAAAGVLGPARIVRAEGECSLPQCNPFNGYCVQTCRVGLPSDTLTFVAARQRSSQWCWAACIQMVFGAHGYDVPQEVFVQQTFGQITDMPGTPVQILNALNRSYTDTAGQTFTGVGDVMSVSLETIAADLRDRQPLIIGALGHATMLTALAWQQDNLGNVQVLDAVIRDPWPGSPSRRSLTAREWANVSFVARVRCI